MFLEIEHRLHFAYDALIHESFLELRVEPRSTERQTLHSFLLAVGPPTKVFRYRDWNGNLVHHFSINDFHDRIEVLARSGVETHAAGSALGELGEPVPARETLGPLLDLTAFDGPVRHSPGLVALAEALPGSDAGLGSLLEAAGSLVHERFRYRRDVTRYDSTTEDFLAAGAGVCQDFAHLLLALLRLRGVPSRYVSGYLHLEQHEPSQSHAWVEVHSRERGWVAYDPTHGRAPDERYAVVGWGRHYDDVPPNRGIYRGRAAETLRAEVQTRIGERKGVAGLHEEIESIDVPVFQELPARYAGESLGSWEQEGDQQQ